MMHRVRSLASAALLQAAVSSSVHKECSVIHRWECVGEGCVHCKRTEEQSLVSLTR